MAGCFRIGLNIGIKVRGPGCVFFTNFFCRCWVNLKGWKTVVSYCGVCGFGYTLTLSHSTASVAQLVEQRFCKPLVVGSSPSAGSRSQRFEPSG